MCLYTSVVTVVTDLFCKYFYFAILIEDLVKHIATTVSYTHLDVYKRQRRGLVIGGLRVLSFVFDGL